MPLPSRREWNTKQVYSTHPGNRIGSKTSGRMGAIPRRAKPQGEVRSGDFSSPLFPGNKRRVELWKIEKKIAHMPGVTTKRRGRAVFHAGSKAFSGNIEELKMEQVHKDAEKIRKKFGSEPADDYLEAMTKASKGRKKVNIRTGKKYVSRAFRGKYGKDVDRGVELTFTSHDRHDDAKKTRYVSKQQVHEFVEEIGKEDPRLGGAVKRSLGMESTGNGQDSASKKQRTSGIGFGKLFGFGRKQKVHRGGSREPVDRRKLYGV